MGNLFSFKKQDNTTTSTTSTTSSEDVTPDHIKQLVFTMLQKKDFNLSFVPDSIEAKVYEKIINMTLRELQQLLSTIKIQFLNQEITLHMNPIGSN
jgi:hypothetical protein